MRQGAFFRAGDIEVAFGRFDLGVAHPFLHRRERHSTSDRPDREPMPQALRRGMRPSLIPTERMMRLTHRHAVVREYVQRRLSGARPARTIAPRTTE